MRFILTIFIFLLLSQKAAAEKSAPIQGQLENGFKYTILPLHSEKGHIEIRLRVNAGSVDENNDQAGVAHMVEHLVFRKTSNYPEGVMSYLHQNKWVRGKNYNAVTTVDNTTYMMVPPATSGLSQSLDVLSQMLFYAALTQDDLENERKIILEEWRQGLGVGAVMNEQRTASVRANSRYARHRVIGTQESINTMPAIELQHFYRTWYAPNNMNLLIVGDVEPQKTKAEIEQYFGKVKARKMPERNYLEPELADRLQINKLQDVRSGVSQIAYILRFDESNSRKLTEEGRYQRLLDRLALSAITQRLRNQTHLLPEGISSLVPRKSDIGHKTAALGFFSSVSPTSHLLGLKQILEEIERLKRFPITQEEFIKQKEIITSQIETAKKHDGDRDFAKWVQAMVDTVLLDKPFYTQPEIAIRLEKQLQRVTLTDVNGRIQQWLNAQDRIVQYQPPRETQVDNITSDIVMELFSNLQRTEIVPPQKIKEIEPMVLADIQGKGHIREERQFKEQSVKYWWLSNGDRVIWLKTPLAKERTYFQAESSAGFNAENLGAWQSQIASQLISQNAPLDWDIEQLNDWKTRHKVNLFIKQTATKLTFDGSVDNQYLANLLRLFYAYQYEIKIKAGLDETKESITQAINLKETQNIENERMKAISMLRYQQENIAQTVPNKASLNSLTEDDLNQQWSKMMAVPTTYYVVNNMSEDEMKSLVVTFLSHFPRNSALKSQPFLQVEGIGKIDFAMNPEPKSDVKIWSFNSHQWQGKDALLVSILRSITTNKLKLALRDQSLGVYSLRFDTTLNPETDRIESELSFVANPTQTEKLIQQAREVLLGLAEQITEEDVLFARNQVIRQEKERLQDPKVWLARLILSENKFGNPSYLSEMQRLVDEITLEKVRNMATKIYNPLNEKVFVTTPKQ
ncbi:insulinase family protein [Ursidibacter sp. B-7004-1]